MTSLRFPRSARVRARGDFDRVFKAGRRVGLPPLALHWHRPDGFDGVRLGLAVSRKVDPHAVGRNRIKRCLREAFRHCRGGLAPGDYVVVARPGAAKLEAPALTAAFHDLLRRAGALPRAEAGGPSSPRPAGIAREPAATASDRATAPASMQSGALPDPGPAGTLAPASPTPPADAPKAPPAEPACP